MSLGDRVESKDPDRIMFPDSASSFIAQTFRWPSWSVCGALAFLLAPPVMAQGGTAKTNVVLIIADDLAWDDSGPYGNDRVRTPNLDRLAAEGMKFNRAILTASSCSPSRASIITGLYPHQTDAEELHWPLPASQVTFVEKLREAGYWTGAAGKWHLGDAIRDRFDVIKDVDTSGFQLPAGDAGKAGKFKETTNGEAKSGCADWVPLLRERPDDRPFFLWLAALDPHRPYEECILENPHAPAKTRLAPYHPDTPGVRREYALYYDEVTRLDQYVGKVLAELTSQGVLDQTLVLFISDNGRPFPRDKTSLYDSGIRTPMLARYPPMVKAGSVCDRLVSALDLAPTFLELANTDKGKFPGVSFVSLLKKADAPPIRTYAFAEKNWHDYEDHSRSVRDRKYKYIRNHYHDLPPTPPADAVRGVTYQALIGLRDKGSLSAASAQLFWSPRPTEELYDCDADPHELTNLAANVEHSGILAKMREALRVWEKETDDDVPTLRTADEFDRDLGTPTAARVRPRKSKAEMAKAGLTAP
ncbi:MAG: N-sulfoglucosamine sulfohydrolase [Verrucomicrobiales bacterium]|jgi:N-sulfoglucosamine sulfohydrolase